jgi:hypothetical protein
MIFLILIIFAFCVLEKIYLIHFYSNNPASGIEALSFCEVKRNKRYSRKPDPKGDAQNIKIQFQVRIIHNIVISTKEKSHPISDKDGRSILRNKKIPLLSAAGFQI